MSDCVNYFGYVFPLDLPVNKEVIEKINEEFFDNHCKGAFINNEGSLLITQQNKNLDQNYVTVIVGRKKLQEAFQIAEEYIKKYDLRISLCLARMYICNWYDGSECDMEYLTKDDLRQLDGKTNAKN